MTDDEIAEIRRTMTPLAGIQIEHLLNDLAETLTDLRAIGTGCNRARWRWIEATRNEKMMRGTFGWPRLEEHIFDRWKGSEPPTYSQEELDAIEQEYKHSEQMRRRVHQCIERINTVAKALSKKKGFWK